MARLGRNQFILLILYDKSTRLATRYLMSFFYAQLGSLSLAPADDRHHHRRRQMNQSVTSNLLKNPRDLLHRRVRFVTERARAAGSEYFRHEPKQKILARTHNACILLDFAMLLN